MPRRRNQKKYLVYWSESVSTAPSEAGLGSSLTVASVWACQDCYFQFGLNVSYRERDESMAPDNQHNATPAPLFLYIPVARLIILSIATFSLYEVYWIYRNWRYIKERDSLKIQPFWRGFFGIFFCHSLLRRIHEDKEARAILEPSFSPQGLATGWVVLIIISNLISRAPGVAASMIAAFIPSFLCLVPVQNYINSVTEQRNPGIPFYRWSSGHIVCLVFGVVVWALLLFALVGNEA